MIPPVHTRVATIRRSEPNHLGWRNLMRAEGEDGGVVPEGGKPLACIWHLSDLHLCDAESPARLTYLDRYSDPDSPMRSELGDVGTYRPQEILTAHVVAEMIATANVIGRGPLSDHPVSAALITGDLTDNAQHNEFSWYLRLVNGGTFTPSSGGDRSTWCGVSDPAFWDEYYWHPDGPPPGFAPDRPTRLYGFPEIPGLIEAARRPITSEGLRYRTLSVHGNHDGLLQGTVAANPILREVAVAGQCPIRLKDHTPLDVIATAIAPVGPANYPPTSATMIRQIDQDTQRWILHEGDFAHEFDRRINYWVEDVDQLRIICLDTVNPFGGWQGSLDEDQWHWLNEELERSRDRHVVIASHHPSPAMTNAYSLDGSLRILGDAVVELLLAHRQVLMWAAGHVHFNAAIRHGNDERWLWEITTSSLIDWPQQGRILEFIDYGNRVGIASTVVDHSSPVIWNPDLPWNVKSLASISRLLAANDYQRRDESALNELRNGSPEVRNVVWWAQRKP